MTHPQPPDAVEPLSCPFCGGAAEWNKGKRGDGSDWRYIACSECEATAPYSNDDGQIEAWNKRPADPLRLALGEAAVRAILLGQAHVVLKENCRQEHRLDQPAVAENATVQPCDHAGDIDAMIDLGNTMAQKLSELERLTQAESRKNLMWWRFMEEAKNEATQHAPAPS